MGKNQVGNQCFVLFTAPKTVEDPAPTQQDIPEAAEYDEVVTGGQQVVQAEVHGKPKDYPLKNEDEKEETDDKEENEEDLEWDAEVARQQEIGVLTIQVCFTSSG